MSLKNDANEYMALKERIEKDSSLKHKQKINTVITIAGIILVSCIVLSLVISLFTGIISFKDIDFSALLSLLMAFFAIGLSVFFYVKANETSNRFYDNTYHFTKDISEKIGRMDERVGEKLSSLGDNTIAIRDQMNNGSFSMGKDLAEAKEKKDEVNNELIKDLKEAIESNNMNTEETIKDLKDKIKLLSESDSKVMELESSMEYGSLSYPLEQMIKGIIRKIPGDISYNDYIRRVEEKFGFFTNSELCELKEAHIINTNHKITLSGKHYITNIFSTLSIWNK